MAKFSETSDDAGDRNKKPKEEEVESLPITQQIPDELIETIVALVRRCHYPKLSLISRAFHRLITSPELYETRSRRGLTESVLYTLIGFSPFGPRSLYILHRSKISLRLSRVNTIPLILPGSVVVTIGYNMYVIGGSVGLFQPVSTVILIDCRFHTWHYLPEMQRARCRAAGGVIDGKIYVIGGCEKRCDDWVEVFDVEKQIWETVPSPLIPNVASSSGEFSTYVVMEEKIYVLDRLCCLAYEPRRCQWETWRRESQLRSLWFTSSCVVDDMLYAIDPLLDLGAPIVVYDPMVMVWRPVKGLERWPKLVYIESKMVNLGEKLVVLGCNQSRYSVDNYWGKDLWCVEIVLEKRQGGEIWGEVGLISRVFTHRVSPFIELSRTVMV